MSKLNKSAILSTISNIEDTADYEENRLEDFLMMKEYSLMQDPKRFLILGGRGSGKTRLFKTFNQEAGFREILSRDSLSGLNASNACSVVGHDDDSGFPAPDILEKYADDKNARAYWAGNLLFVLLDALKAEPEVQDIVQTWGHDDEVERFFQRDLLTVPDKWINYISSNPESWENILEKLNSYLRQKERWIFVSYDRLDLLTIDYNSLFPFIRMLLSFWFAHDRRWDRIRCKIFLRNDLYESDLLDFMDASKLNNHIIRLEWDTLSLYRLLIKRMANANDLDTLEYLQLIPGLISEDNVSALGYIPTMHKSLIERLIDEMIGHYMGRSPKQGVSYQWMPNHLQDAKGALAPRAFLKCFSFAAQGMLTHPDEISRLENNRLILPSMIQNALVRVSEDRVAELKEEYPWLEELKTMLSGLTMLVGRDLFLERIDMSQWTEKHRKKLPSQNAQGIFQVLQKLGIILVASDGRINMPEIYLHGFGVKRKGGLRRKVED